MKKIQGIIAAPFTPFNSNGDIDIQPIKDYAQHLKKNKVSGVFVCGTTGEGMLMTSEERKRIAEEWVKYQDADFQVIVHVGTASTRQSRALAQHAEKIGANGISCMGPVFYKPDTVEKLVEFCGEIASGAPRQRFYYYHIPSVSGVNHSMVDFIKSAKNKIPNFSGIKYTHDNLTEMKDCLTMDNGKWNIFHGFDEILLTGLSQGVTSAVGSTYNFMPSIYIDIINDFFNNDLNNAQIKQSKAYDIIQVLFKYGGPVVAGKSIMKLIGLDCGPCRLPLSNLTNDEIENLKKELIAQNFFELIK